MGGLKWVLRMVFRLLLIRVGAMDFLVSLITSEHLFERSLDTMQRVKAQEEKEKAEEESSKIHEKLPSEQSESGAPEGTSAEDAEIEKLEEMIISECAEKLYEVDWEHVALMDVLQMQEERKRTLDALVDINVRFHMETTKKHDQGIEMTTTDLGREAEAGSPKSEVPTEDQDDYNDFLRKFRPEYRAPPSWEAAVEWRSREGWRGPGWSPPIPWQAPSVFMQGWSDFQPRPAWGGAWSPSGWRDVSYWSPSAPHPGRPTHLGPPSSQARSQSGYGPPPGASGFGQDRLSYASYASGFGPAPLGHAPYGMGHMSPPPPGSGPPGSGPLGSGPLIRGGQDAHRQW